MEKIFFTFTIVFAAFLTACEKEELGDFPDLNLSKERIASDYSLTPHKFTYEFSFSATIYNGSTYEVSINFGNGETYLKSGLVPEQ